METGARGSRAMILRRRKIGEAWSRPLLNHSSFADFAFGTRNSSAHHPSKPRAKLRLYHLCGLLKRNTINY